MGSATGATGKPRAGFGAITPELGLGLFDAALANGAPALVPAALDCPRCGRPWPRAGRRTSSGTWSVRWCPCRQAARAAAGSGWAERLAALSAEDGRAEVGLLVRGLVAGGGPRR